MKILQRFRYRRIFYQRVFDRIFMFLPPKKKVHVQVHVNFPQNYDTSFSNAHWVLFLSNCLIFDFKTFFIVYNTAFPHWNIFEVIFFTIPTVDLPRNQRSSTPDTFI